MNAPMQGSNRRTIVKGAAVAFAATLMPRAAGASGVQFAVRDARTGVLLLGQGAGKRRHPASLTKMMSLYQVFAAMNDGKTDFNLKSQIEIPSIVDLIGPGIAVIESLEVGKSYPARELLMAVGSRSDARSTLALVVHTGKALGWDEAKPSFGTARERELAIMTRFIKRMNAAAGRLGMNDTLFRVTTGLPSEGHYSTPGDIALLVARLHHEFPALSEIAMGKAEPDFRVLSTPRRHSSRLLRARPGEIHFAKTGWTNAAGYCLAVYATVNGRDMVGTVIGADDRSHCNGVMMNALTRASDMKIAVVPVPARRPE